MIAKPIVIAAGRWIRLLETNQFRDAVRLTRTSPPLADLTPGQYESGWELLSQWGLRHEDTQTLSSNALERLLERYLLEANPLWLQSGEEFISDPDLLPVDVADLSLDLDLTPQKALIVARRAAGKYDSKRQAEIGLDGERVFVDWLTKHSDAYIEHTSLFDDRAGYDIRISQGPLEAHFEIKTTTREGSNFRFFLSRNEFETMKSYPTTWHLQLIRLSVEDHPKIYSLDSAWVANVMPEDKLTTSRWASAEVVVEASQLSRGLHTNATWCLRDEFVRGDGS